MIQVLALDPGKTTGYCLFEVEHTQDSDGGELYNVDQKEWGNLDIEDLPESILTTYSKNPNLKVILENVAFPYPGPLQKLLLEVTVYLSTLFPQGEWVQPGTWKTTRLSPLPTRQFEHKPTPHQKDAYHLGIWYIVKNLGWRVVQGNE